MEWVEVHGKTVEVAIEAALAELGLSSKDEAQVEIIQEPSAGFLGLGGKDAIVKVSNRPRRPRRRRRSGRRDEPRSDDRAGEGRGDGGARRQAEAKTDRGARQPSDGAGNRSSSGNRRSGGGGGGGGSRGERPRGDKPKPRRDDRPEAAPITEQADVAKEFLVGLLDAFGLEGAVDTRIEEDILWIEVVGPQTEALVGPKGAVLQSVHEVTRTVVQRKTFGAPRMRLDIAGYAERRREALRIYTQRLTERLLATGGEIMLEPMNAADRKVVHDTVVDIPGVRSFSEGEDPDRAVVLALEEGFAAATVGAGEAPRHEDILDEDDDAGDDEDVVSLEPEDLGGEEE